MAAPNALQNTIKLYQSVIDEVTNNVKEAFLDEGVDEAVLTELKQMWENKVLATRVIESVSSVPSHTATNRSSSLLNIPRVGRGETSASPQPPYLLPSTSNFAANEGVINMQQHQHRADQHVKRNIAASLVERGIEYNPSSSLSSTDRGIPLLQQTSSNAANYLASGALLSSSPLNALMRGLPHSIIANVPNNIYMQMAGVQAPFQTLLGQSLARHTSPYAALARPVTTKVNNSATTTGSVLVVQQPSLNNNSAAYASNAPLTQQNSATSSNNRPTGKLKSNAVIQLDGPTGLSEDEEEDEDLVEEEEDEEINVEEEEPDEPPSNILLNEGDALNSEDDEASNGNGEEMFEADDVVVCQFEKISRIRNKWKFILKDGIINLNRKDYVFNKAVGEAEF